MADLTDLLAAAREASVADEATTRRLKERLMAEVVPEASPLAGALKGIGAADDEAIRRVQARLAATQRRRHRGRRIVGAVALAAAVVVTVGSLFELDPRTATDEVRLTARDVTELQANEHVALTFTGDGDLRDSPAGTRIAWRRGRLQVDVTPHAGVDLTVGTEEAVIHVVGTVFRVDRDPLGTHVAISRGQVEVACHGAPTIHQLTPGGSGITCLPTTLGGLLGRVKMQMTEDATVDAVLATIDHATTVDGPAPIHEELEIHRIRLLVGSGRMNEAREAIDAYLQNPRATRYDEVRKLKRRLR